MATGLYIWRDGRPVAVPITEDWTLDDPNAEPVSPGAEVPTKRHAAYTDLPCGAQVSTVFLAIDHALGSQTEPVLFETMIFWPGHALDDSQWRYHTRDEALAGHEAAIALVLAQ
jgi:hypothetical protein